LTKSSIKYNAGMRAIAKLLLNSLWGYLAMNNDRVSHKMINDRAQWFKFVNDDTIKITNVDFSNMNMLHVIYKNVDEKRTTSNKTNVVVAAFITSQARLKLYDELYKLGNRVLYCDTDSIIFVCNTDKQGIEYMPKIGEFLGELTSELDDDDYIAEFVSAGPKNYSYKTMKGKTKCTIKGFTLNYITDLSLNFEKIKDIVLNDRTAKVPVTTLKISRTIDYRVKSNYIEKNYGFVYDKRILQSDLTTLPFGYIHNNII
jgi:DNA polymerase elongation subunit (family B)